MITTYSGKTVDPLAIRPEDIEIEDIAHALSMTCRFGGHCRSFYSVAEHSVLVAGRCPPEIRLDGLLHNAAEAYLGDFPGPLKRKFPTFEKAELNLYRNVAERFGLEFPIPEPVRKADEAMRRAELSVLFPGDSSPHDGATSIRCLPPPEAKELFLSSYRTITAPQPRGSSPNLPMGGSSPDLPVEGAVLGVDVGWSERQRSSAACLLSWTESSFDIRCQRFTARPDDLRNGLNQVLAGSTVLTAAIDGPLRGSLDEIGVYRDAERVLTRRLQKHIGKGDTVPLEVGRWYDFHEFGWHLGNVGSIRCFEEGIPWHSACFPCFLPPASFFPCAGPCRGLPRPGKPRATSSGA